jgi:Uma2 family endonuclease
MATMTSEIIGFLDPLVVPHDGWTVDTLPDTEWHYELVDGCLLVTPPPHFRHVVIANELCQLLGRLLPREWGAAADPGLYVDLLNYREPDLVVYRRAAIAKGRLEPGDVLLAVEVMGPSSVATDRVAKPAQYAAAGISHFWRIEQDPLTLFAYVLEGSADAGTYRLTGAFTDEVTVTEPVPATFRLSDLLPN